MREKDLAIKPLDLIVRSPIAMDRIVAKGKHVDHGKVAEPRFLDLCGLKCPLPALRTAKLLRRLCAGGRVSVACTDPLSVIDIPHLLRQTGDVLEGMEEKDGVILFRIRRSTQTSRNEEQKA